jgi:long-chain fatty acid transport protein
MNRNAAIFGILAVTAFTSNLASATTESIGGYDGRSMGMGGTGAAFLDNSSAIFYNPAQLDAVSNQAYTLALAPSHPVMTSPINGPGTTTDSSTGVFPLFFMGGAYRVSERVTLGIAGYATAGVGSEYSNLSAFGGDGFKFGLVAFEVAPTASYRLSDRLSVGLSYRINYAYETQHAPQLGPTTPATDGTLHGWNFFGVRAGLSYKATDDLTLALSYRSQVTIETSGTETIGGTDYNARSQFPTPHAIIVGGAYTLLEKRLLLASDFRYSLYKTAFKQIPTTVDLPAALGGTTTQSTVANWKNAASLSLGGEYWICPQVPLRAGYFVSSSATPGDLPGYFFPSPGFVQSVHLGSGYRINRWELEAGAMHAWSSDDVTTVAPGGGIPGHYATTQTILELSATYRI